MCLVQLALENLGEYRGSIHFLMKNEVIVYTVEGTVYPNPYGMIGLYHSLTETDVNRMFNVSLINPFKEPIAIENIYSTNPNIDI